MNLYLKNFNNISKNNFRITIKKMVLKDRLMMNKMNKFIILEKIISNLNSISANTKNQLSPNLKFMNPLSIISKFLSYLMRRKKNISRCQLQFLVEARRNLLWIWLKCFSKKILKRVLMKRNNLMASTNLFLLESLMMIQMIFFNQMIYFKITIKLSNKKQNLKK